MGQGARSAPSLVMILRLSLDRAFQVVRGIWSLMLPREADRGHGSETASAKKSLEGEDDFGKDWNIWLSIVPAIPALVKDPLFLGARLRLHKAVFAASAVHGTANGKCSRLKP